MSHSTSLNLTSYLLKPHDNSINSKSELDTLNGASTAIKHIACPIIEGMAI
jgi:hypothetical protein